MEKSFIILSLGCDVLIPPGSSITGGQAVFALNLANELAKKRDTTLITLRFDNKSNFIKKNKYDFNIVEIPLERKEYYNESLLLNYSKIEQICLKKITPEKFRNSYVISIYWLSGLFIYRNKAYRPKTWVHSFASYAKQKTESYNNLSYLTERSKSEKYIGNEVDYIWATNYYEESFLQQKYGFQKEKIKIIPRAVNKESLNKLPTVSHFKWDVIYYGRLDKRKGIFDIPQVFRQLKTMKPIRLLIVGGTIAEINNYENWFNKNFPDVINYHNITFQHAVPQNELFRLVLFSKISFLPSHSETFANAINESLLLGRPVVTTDVGGIPEFKKHYKNCFIYKHSSLKIAVDYIKKILDNHPRYVTSPFVPFCYTWEYSMEKLNEILEKKY